MTYKPVEPIACVICAYPKTAARKLCRRCYTREAKLGNLSAFPILGPQDVFLGRIEKTDSCWIWSGTKNGYGYGIFLMPGERAVRAHRYSYEYFKGPIPDGMVVMHTCDNPPCVNPDHLQIGTKADNNADAASKGRTPSGPRHWNYRLPDAQVVEIRESQLPQSTLALKYGVTQSHISRIKSGQHRARGE